MKRTTVRMVPLPSEIREAISRNIELGREWQKGYDVGEKAGRSIGFVVGVVACMVLTIVAAVLL